MVGPGGRQMDRPAKISRTRFSTFSRTATWTSSGIHNFRNMPPCVGVTSAKPSSCTGESCPFPSHPSRSLVYNASPLSSSAIRRIVLVCGYLVTIALVACAVIAHGPPLPYVNPTTYSPPRVLCLVLLETFPPTPSSSISPSSSPRIVAPTIAPHNPVTNAPSTPLPVSLIFRRATSPLSPRFGRYATSCNCCPAFVLCL